MIKLSNALNAWRTADFKRILKAEIEQLNGKGLPLQQGLSQGNFACNDKVSVIILDVSEDNDCIHARAGIFYTSLITGCSCADDPTPDNEYNEYCEVQFDINKMTAETEITTITE